MTDSAAGTDTVEGSGGGSGDGSGDEGSVGPCANLSISFNSLFLFKASVILISSFSSWSVRSMSMGPST